MSPVLSGMRNKPKDTALLGTCFGELRIKIRDQNVIALEGYVKSLKLNNNNIFTDSYFYILKLYSDQRTRNQAIKQKKHWTTDNYKFICPLFFTNIPYRHIIISASVSTKNRNRSGPGSSSPR